jgi:hypothetical protein
MTDSTSGLHHSRPSRAVAEPTCWSERSIQQAIITIRNNHTQPAARWVNQQAYTHSYAPSVKYIGVLTLGGVSALQCRLAVVIATAGARAYMGVWGLCPQWGPGAKPLVRGLGGEAP